MSERELIDPGWYKEIPDERYHGSGGVSSTSLKYLLQRAPNYFLYRQKEPFKQTPAMKLGSLVHSMILEPDTVDEKYCAQPDFGDQRKKANKEAKQIWLLENLEKEPVTEGQFEQANKMTANVFANPIANSLLDGAINESSVYWWYKSPTSDERQYKQMCKVRPDCISVNHPGVLVDIKTTDDASFSGFSKSIHKYLYHLSAAMYLEGANQCQELLDEVGCFFFTDFIFICIEKEYPYNVACYKLSKKDLNLGKSLYKKAIMTLHDAKENDFPGYPEEIREIDLPGYAQYGHVV